MLEQERNTTGAVKNKETRAVSLEWPKLPEYLLQEMSTSAIPTMLQNSIAQIYHLILILIHHAKCSPSASSTHLDCVLVYSFRPWLQ